MSIRRKHSTGYVWIISSLFLFLYGFLILGEYDIPGLESIVAWISHIDPRFIHEAACVSMFVEGLYVAGNFFPGSTLVVLVALLSQESGLFVYGLTILSVFLGWFLAGLVNMYCARFLSTTTGETVVLGDTKPRDQRWLTWFPSFRANHEVAMILSGTPFLKALLDTTKVKLLVSCIMLLLLALISSILDIQHLNNEEGVFSVFFFGVVGLIVGIQTLRKDSV